MTKTYFGEARWRAKLLALTTHCGSHYDGASRVEFDDDEVMWFVFCDGVTTVINDVILYDLTGARGTTRIAARSTTRAHQIYGEPATCQRLTPRP